MALTKDGTTLREAIQRANPNELADIFRALGIGQIIRQLPTQRYGDDPAASGYNLATLEAVVLPDFAKGAFILDAFVRVGTVNGQLTVVKTGATPGTGEVGIAPNGDIVVLAADAITSIDLLYTPRKMEVYEQELAVVAASGILTLPVGATPGVVLLEAEATAGTVTGKKIILVPGTAPATTQARLNLTKTQVLFNVATDAVTKARVKWGVAAKIDVNALLEAKSAFV